MDIDMENDQEHLDSSGSEWSDDEDVGDYAERTRQQLRAVMPNICAAPLPPRAVRVAGRPKKKKSKQKKNNFRTLTNIIASSVGRCSEELLRQEERMKQLKQKVDEIKARMEQGICIDSDSDEE